MRKTLLFLAFISTSLGSTPNLVTMNQINAIYSEAIKGNIDAMLQLGSLYRDHNYNFKTDTLFEQEAINWYKKAEECTQPIGNIEAERNLGDILSEKYFKTTELLNKYVKVFASGDKIAIDSFEYYRRASDKGDISAQTSLGDCYLLGIGTTADAKKAIYKYQQAAIKGSPRAQYALGYCYYYGYEMPKNIDLAFYWIKCAAENGNIAAQQLLGYFYYYAVGTSANDLMAFTWQIHNISKSDSVTAYLRRLPLKRLAYLNDEAKIKLIQEAEVKNTEITKLINNNMLSKKNLLKEDDFASKRTIVLYNDNGIITSALVEDPRLCFSEPGNMVSITNQNKK